MPELPEVEHISRALNQAVSGAKVISVEIRLPRLIAGVSPTTFRRHLRNSSITSVGRRGKWILFQLDSNRVLMVHLRMTGKFVTLSPEQPVPPYAHVIFYLADERRLVYCDMRQFGRLTVVANNKIEASDSLKALAPEPFSQNFNSDYLRTAMSKSRRSIKEFLLDQTRVLGLGNIYASEALFLARINPRSAANSISRLRVERLLEAIRNTLDEAIASGSTLRIDLTDGDGDYIGTDERFWRVYEREGEPCVNCGAAIKRLVQGARSSYYCPRCQR